MKAKKYTNTEIGILADTFKKSVATIIRWINSGDDRLTSDKAKTALKKRTVSKLDTQPQTR